MNNKDYLKKQLEYKSNLVGQGFHTQLEDNRHACVNIFGEILEASNFDNSQLFLQWKFKIPPGWELDDNELLELDQKEYEDIQLEEWNRIQSITQQSKVNTIKNDDGTITAKAHFCFPFDLQLQVDENELNFGKFPQLLVQVSSMDSWERNYIQGYGFIEIPHTPGFHELTMKTYRPNDDLYTRVYEFFLGGGTKVKDLDSISNAFYFDKQNQPKVLNRFPIDTESSGDIKIRVNVSIQRESYQTMSRKKDYQQKNQEMKTKYRERLEYLQQQQEIQTGLPTALIKTDMGYVNRFHTTNLPQY
ncbi:unnamed protein product [Paramecium octaurelia]|uniref:Uncharacterized protein n=1 Tax=Paramecium octaurelia TaxID=43137 RepID=A0A8S1TU93_PAROT|nr:unnamed protein product [Paramecium octaurelia]